MDKANWREICCLKCGTSVWRYCRPGGPAPKFCSNACASRYNAQRPEVIAKLVEAHRRRGTQARKCSVCGEPGHNSRRHEREGAFITVTCAHCGTEFKVNPKKRRKFCSMTCSNRYNTGRPEVRQRLSRVVKQWWIDSHGPALQQLAEARKNRGAATQRALFKAWVLMWGAVGGNVLRDRVENVLASATLDVRGPQAASASENDNGPGHLATTP